MSGSACWPVHYFTCNVLVFEAASLVYFVFSRQPRVELKRSVMDAPFLCIRVVTRGLYPTLVNQNVRSHLEVANKVGLTNFVVEVVTDNQFDLDITDHQVKYVKQTIGNTKFVYKK